MFADAFEQDDASVSEKGPLSAVYPYAAMEAGGWFLGLGRMNFPLHTRNISQGITQNKTGSPEAARMRPAQGRWGIVEAMSLSIYGIFNRDTGPEQC